MPYGRNETIFTVSVALHLTNLEEKEIHISETRLRFSRYLLLRRENQGDLSLVDPFEGSMLNAVMPGRRMVYGTGTWKFRWPLAREGSVTTGRICIVDSFGRRSWSKKIKIPSMNNPNRML
jgi:hypothetical protein